MNIIDVSSIFFHNYPRFSITRCPPITKRFPYTTLFRSPRRRCRHRRWVPGRGRDRSRPAPRTVAGRDRPERWRSRPCPRRRSEEHTSELQSRVHLVCRLLLEKKKYKHLHYVHVYDLT